MVAGVKENTPFGKRCTSIFRRTAVRVKIVVVQFIVLCSSINPVAAQFIALVFYTCGSSAINCATTGDGTPLPP